MVCIGLNRDVPTLTHLIFPNFLLQTVEGLKIITVMFSLFIASLTNVNAVKLLPCPNLYRYTGLLGKLRLNGIMCSSVLALNLSRLKIYLRIMH